MTATYVKCTHTKGNRVQACVLVLVGDRMACIPFAPAENAVGKIAGGLAMAAAGIVTLRLGNRAIDASELATTEDLDGAVTGSGGFYVGADWTYRTRVPVIGTMLMHADQVITTRERVRPEMLAQLTPNRAPPSIRVVVVICSIGAAILAAAGITYLATGSIELLVGIGFWGLLLIATSVYAWIRIEKSAG